MGNISIIARRLSDRYVQYGWSGNGGYFRTVGNRLLTWYNTPDMVEYLFGLGQLRHLWKPYSEKSAAAVRTERSGEPHWVSPSERYIFSKIAFIDCGYFYDADQTWYYVHPGPFRLKIPLTLMEANLDGESFEFSFLERVEHLVLDEIFSECRMDRLERAGHGRADLQRTREDLARKECPLHNLYHDHRSVFDCFDDWVLIRPDESGRNVGEIILRSKEEQHTETIHWPCSAQQRPAEPITFGMIRKYCSRANRVSICRRETLTYENFRFIGDVPHSYDALCLYGIGGIESEFYGEDGLADPDAGYRNFLPCMEFMLSETPGKGMEE